MTYRLPTSAERPLMTAFLEAMQQGDPRAVLDTPAAEQKQQTLSKVLASAAVHKEDGPYLIACLVRAVQAGIKSPDITTRMTVWAEAANIARLFADSQAPKPTASVIDLDAEDDSPADPEESFARAAAFAGACFPTVRRGAA